MLGAGTGGTAGQDLAALRKIFLQAGSILVIHMGHLVNTELANLSALAGLGPIVSIVRHFQSSNELEWQIAVVFVRQVGKRADGIGCGSVLTAAAAVSAGIAAGITAVIAETAISVEAGALA